MVTASSRHETCSPERQGASWGWLCLAGAALFPQLAAAQPLALPPPAATDQPVAMQNAVGDPTPQPLPEQILAAPTISAEMQVIHRRSQLLLTRSGVVRMQISDPNILDVIQYSPTELSIIGLALGSTTLTMWFEGNPDPLIYLITVIRDPSIQEQQRIDYGKLEKKLALLFPNSKVYLIPISNKVIVRGQARDSEEAAWILSIIRGEIVNQMGALLGPQPAAAGVAGVDYIAPRWNPLDLMASNIINQLVIPGDFQVMLRVRIAELSRGKLRRMGVNWSVAWNEGRHILASQLTSGTPVLSGVFENGDVSVLLDAMAANNVAQILSEPNLVVLSGHDATILSGGEFAVPTIVGIGGVGGQQTVFRGFGVSVVVTPTVLDKDLVRMRIRPEFSQINTNRPVTGGGLPTLNTRRVDTTVELREGQTIVLGGLLSSQFANEIDGIPFLGGLPVIGPLLFNSKRLTHDETELLIMVSPEIVRPLEPDEVPPVPGFEIVPPDDHLLFTKAFLQGPNDPNVYQLAPYGHGSGTGVAVGYTQYNPSPASPGYAPVPTSPFGAPPAASTPFSAGAGRYAPPGVNQPQQQGMFPPGGADSMPGYQGMPGQPMPSYNMPQQGMLPPGGAYQMPGYQGMQGQPMPGYTMPPQGIPPGGTYSAPGAYQTPGYQGMPGQGYAPSMSQPPTYQPYSTPPGYPSGAMPNSNQYSPPAGRPSGSSTIERLPPANNGPTVFSRPPNGGGFRSQMSPSAQNRPQTMAGMMRRPQPAPQPAQTPPPQLGFPQPARRSTIWPAGGFWGQQAR